MSGGNWGHVDKSLFKAHLEDGKREEDEITLGADKTEIIPR